MIDFVIPLGEHEWPEDQYFVKIEFQQSDLVINEIKFRIQDDPCAINDARNIGGLLSLISKNVTQYNDAMILRLLSILHIGSVALSKIISNLCKMINNPNEVFEKKKLLLVRNSVKIFVFLICRTIVIEQENSLKGKNNTMDSVGNSGSDEIEKKAFVNSSKSGPHSRKSLQVQKTSSEVGKTIGNIQQLKEAILVVMVGILDLELDQLWGYDIEENLLNQFTQLAFKLLSSPENCRNISIRNSCTAIIAPLILKYKRSSECISHIMHTIRSNPSFVNTLVHLIELIKVDDVKVRHFMTNIFTEISKIPPQDLSASSDYAKTLLSLIESMAEKHPQLIIPSTPLLLELLSHESHFMRTAVIHCTGRLIIYLSKSLSTPDDSNPGEIDDSVRHNELLREELLQTLIERFHDANSYVRAQVVQTWITLCIEGVITNHTIYNHVAKCCLSRLKDKTASVRKGAIRLMHDILIYNPYHKDLSIAKWNLLLSNLQEKLDALKRKDPNFPGANPMDVVLSNDSQEEILSELPSGFGKYLTKLTLENMNAVVDNDTEEKKTRELMEQTNRVTTTLEFIEYLSEATSRIIKLLKSKVISDVAEAIRFLPKALLFNFEEAVEGIKVVLMLICSTEPQIKEAAKEAYFLMFFQQSKNVPRGTYIAYNLIRLTQNATLGQIISLEELLRELFKDENDHDLKQLLQKLYDILVLGAKPELIQGTMIITSIFSNIYPKYIVKWVSLITDYGLGKMAIVYPNLAKWACLTLQRLSSYIEKLQSSNVHSGNMKSSINTILKSLPSFDESFLRNFTNLLEMKGPIFPSVKGVGNITPIETQAWYPPAEQAIGVIYAFSPDPQPIMMKILKDLCAQIFPDHCNMDAEMDLKNAQKIYEYFQESGNVHLSRKTKLERLIFLVGHVAINQMAFIEKLFSRKIAIVEANKDHKPLMRGNEAIEDGVEELSSETIGLDIPKLEQQRNILLKRITEDDNFIGAFFPLIKMICKDESIQQEDPFFHGIAVNALCKCSLVCSEYCSENISLLGELLQNPKTKAATRCNIIVALSDIAMRFPNVFDTYPNLLFDVMSMEKDPFVRRNALTVLSHLILSLMVKPKGRLGDFAICLEDSNVHVSDLAHMFFQEFAKSNKDSFATQLPETFAWLNNRSIPLDSFKNIVHFLLSFVEGQKELVLLTEKIVFQFQNNTNTKAVRNLSYCINCISHSEATMLKLIELFKVYKHSLYDEHVKEDFLAACSKSKRQKEVPNAKKLEDMIRSIDATLYDPTEDDLERDANYPSSTTQKKQAISRKRERLRRAIA